MKDKGIFSVMDAMDLTTLEIFQSRMEHKFLMRVMKEWDDDLKFSRYGREFSPVDLLTGTYRAIGTKELVAGLHKIGLGGYLSGNTLAF
jgi:hypothetical protein